MAKRSHLRHEIRSGIGQLSAQVDHSGKLLVVHYCGFRRYHNCYNSRHYYGPKRTKRASMRNTIKALGVFVTFSAATLGFANPDQLKTKQAGTDLFGQLPLLRSDRIGAEANRTP